jgi:hypothetical protein
MSSASSMADMSGGLGFMIEAIIAAFVAAVVVIASLWNLRERHRDVSAWHVHVGAAIYGVVIGVVVGFVIVPLRFVLASGRVDPQTAAWASFGFIAVMIALRRGLLGRLPFLGPQVRAYRRAALRRSIEGAQKQLEKLMPKTATLAETGA